MDRLRGRFAPSPSGDMHLGNAWTAFLAWLQVRQAYGAFILRIEDLDPERSQAKYTVQIKEDLHWLGLDWDEGPDKEGPFGPYCQSQRRHLYDEALKKLRQKGLIYPCFCSRADLRSATLAPHQTEAKLEYIGTCRRLTQEEACRRVQEGCRYSLRFRLSDEAITFQDLNYGRQTMNPLTQQGDFVVRRSDDVHAYQLAVVVDDAMMKISHVLRGEDLLFSTPRQIALYRALDRPVPRFTHIPLLYGTDGRRLSKRHGALSLRALREKGTDPRDIIGIMGFWAGLLPRPRKVWPHDLIPLFDVKKLPQKPILVDSDALLEKGASFNVPRRNT